jgi:replicative DNA helicase
VIVDYLQLLRPENPKENRVQQVGMAARQVKHLARTCNVPVLMLCQLNRDVESRTDGTPRLSDLRESGDIEAHADSVILLHRPKDNLDEAECWRIEAIVAKNRNGPTGMVPLSFRRSLMRFESSIPGVTP